MKIKVLFFSAAAETAGTDFIFLENVHTTERATTELLEKFPALKGLHCRYALNKVILNESVPLRDGDELAVLPPFSGG
jgi:molybdopterin converting factor small subunit